MTAIQGLRGTRDFYPKEMNELNIIFNAWKAAARKFNYQEFDGPMLEPAELWTLKSGNEIPEQMYCFDDKSGKKIAVLGLAFKENTDDVRDSVAIDVIRELKKSGAVVCAYDPLANGAMKKIFPDVAYAATTSEALKGADACLVLTAWQEFSDLSDEDFSVMGNKIIIEGRRVLDRSLVSSFEGVCWQ